MLEARAEAIDRRDARNLHDADSVVLIVVCKEAYLIVLIGHTPVENMQIPIAQAWHVSCAKHNVTEFHRRDWRLAAERLEVAKFRHGSGTTRFSMCPMPSISTRTTRSE